MAYQHDVFISYRRQELWTPWARDHFKKLLEAYLHQELAIKKPDIFIDERIDVGADWVDELGLHLATSKALVVIFSADYFGSDWCLHELDLMLERCKTCDCKLIIPVIVHDGDLIPVEATRIQAKDFSKYRITHIIETTPMYQEFSQAMKQLAPDVHKAIQAAPDFNDAWVNQCKQRFNDVFQAINNDDKLEPTQFIAKRPASPTTPPRLI